MLGTQLPKPEVYERRYRCIPRGLLAEPTMGLYLSSIYSVTFLNLENAVIL